MREAFAMQKLLTYFQQKYWHVLDINVKNFNKMLPNDFVSFEQPGPEIYNIFQPSESVTLSCLNHENQLWEKRLNFIQGASKLESPGP